MRFNYAVIVVLALSSGCKGLRVDAPLGAMTSETCHGGQCYTQQKCEGLRGKYRVWGGIAVGSATRAGGGGLSAALPDSGGARLGLGIGAAAVGLISAVAVYLRDDVTKEYTDYCTRPKPGNS